MLEMPVPFLHQVEEGSLAVWPVDLSLGRGHRLSYLLCLQYSCAIEFPFSSSGR